jgi:hypothetical protein
MRRRLHVMIERLGTAPSTGMRRQMTIWGITNFALAAVVSFAVDTLVPAEIRGTSAPAKLAAALPYPMLVLAAVCFAPLLETWAQALPIALCRRFKVSHYWTILLCGVIFGGGHYLNGGLGHGLVTFVGGCVLGEACWRNWPLGAARACGVTAGAHAVSNALALTVAVLI